MNICSKKLGSEGGIKIKIECGNYHFFSQVINNDQLCS